MAFLGVCDEVEGFWDPYSYIIGAWNLGIASSQPLDLVSSVYRSRDSCKYGKKVSSREGEGGAGGSVEGDGTGGHLVRIGLPGIGKADSARPMGFLAEVWAHLWVVKSVPGSFPDSHNLIPQVLSVFQDTLGFKLYQMTYYIGHGFSYPPEFKKIVSVPVVVINS